MNWLLQIHATHAVAHAIGVLALVCLAGMALGSVKVRGIGLGTAGVLFAGILTGYVGNPIDHATLEFVKEFGLVLFIFTIAFGIAIGAMPIAIPALPQPLRLGLAGGVLVMALMLGRLGRIGPLVWHMPANVNLAFREFGIALFFAAVGLTAGGRFFSTVFSPAGVLWVLAGSVITISPLLVVGVFARAVLKMNFMALSGLLAGSMTDPPALAFASNISHSDAPMVSYATVYPLTMVLRILSAQILVLLLCG